MPSKSAQLALKISAHLMAKRGVLYVSTWLVHEQHQGGSSGVKKVVVDPALHFAQLHQSLTNGGALVVSVDSSGRPNPMTIGWASMGTAWSRPVLTILVRHSRYTYECLNTTGDFTVCVPYPQTRSVVEFCGTRSGRDCDKFVKCGLTVLPSQAVSSPGIAECGVIWECRTIYTSDPDTDTLAPELVSTIYGGGDYHRIYFGQVERCIADPDFETRFAL